MASFLTGRFEGYFYTQQKRPLDRALEQPPTDNAHRVHLYEGTLRDARMEVSSLPPGTEPPRDALWLYQVPNIQVHPADEDGLAAYVTNFREIILREVEVLNSWEHDGKTYGQLRAHFTGVPTAPLGNSGTSSGIIPDPPDNPSMSTLYEGHPIPVSTVGGGGGSGFLSGFDGRSGGDSRKGCLRTLGILLGALLLLALLSALFRGCGSSGAGGGENTGSNRELVRCEETNQDLERRNKRLEYENKRLQRQLDSLRQALDLAEVNCTLKNYAQRIYFYGDRDDIRERSSGTIKELANLMSQYPDIRIRIEGHMNPTTDEVAEKLRDLDLRRAKRVKSLLTERGVAAERIEVVGKGSTEPIVPSDQLDEDFWGNKYNKNMRVVIKIIQ